LPTKPVPSALRVTLALAAVAVARIAPAASTERRKSAQLSDDDE
jgi:hypothetical protein